MGGGAARLRAGGAGGQGRRRLAAAAQVGGGAAATQVGGSALGSTVAADGALGLFLPRASGGGRSKGVISRRFKILRVYLQKS